MVQIRIAIEKDLITRFELDVWSFNIDARHFYAKHGFLVFNEKMSCNTELT